MLATTLCYLERDDAYLMLHRISKKNDVNRDKWIGVGGKFEPGEAPEECLVREVREETGYILDDYAFRGVLTFVNTVYEPEYIFLYTSSSFHRDETAEELTDEGTLEWVSKSEILSLNLWEGDKEMFRLLEREQAPFSLKLVYEGDRLVKAERWL